MDIKKEFIGIIKANEGLIYKIARVYTENYEDQQDLYQEIVYQLWKSYSSFKNDAKISTWMYRIALNISITHLNKQKKNRRQVPIEALPDKTHIEDTLQDERVEFLYATIKKLSTIEKGIILLYLEDKSYEEISSITGFTVTNIGTRLGRIRQKIKSQIQK